MSRLSRLREMPRFRDMNPIPIAVVGLVLTALVVLAALQYDRLPFLNSSATYKAAFTDAAGLVSGDDVMVAGIKVGTVRGIALDGNQVVATFTVDKDIALGEDTAADIKTASLLGKRELRVRPEGRGTLGKDQVIPTSRTTTPYSLNSALGDLTDTISDIDTNVVNKSLNAFSDSLKDTPPELRSALDGVTALSESLNKRDESLKELLKNANGVTGVLAKRSDQLNALVVDGNSLFTQLDDRKAILNQLIINIGAVSRQLTGFVQDNEQQMKPTLDQLNGVLAVLEKNRDNLSESLDGIPKYEYALGESVGSGPYFQAYVQNFVNLGPSFLPNTDWIKPFLHPIPNSGQGAKPASGPGAAAPKPAASKPAPANPTASKPATGDTAANKPGGR